MIIRSSFLRFLLVGLFNTACGLTVMYAMLHAAEASYWLSTWTGNAVGACVSYIGNRKFTFKSKTSILWTALRFAIVISICYVTAFSLGKFLAGSDDIAVLLGTAMYTLLNYTGQKYIVFGVPSKKPHIA